jgi:hypothetical protein
VVTPVKLTPLGNQLGTINSYRITKPHDRGPTVMAHGVVSLSAAGVPETYQVASGDDYSYVAARLGLSEPYLATLNSVRRTGFDLYVGDILNLDPTRIASVGDENGAVAHEALPDGAPTQH